MTGWGISETPASRIQARRLAPVLPSAGDRWPGPMPRAGDCCGRPRHLTTCLVGLTTAPVWVFHPQALRRGGHSPRQDSCPLDPEGTPARSWTFPGLDFMPPALPWRHLDPRPAAQLRASLAIAPSAPFGTQPLRAPSGEAARRRAHRVCESNAIGREGDPLPEATRSTRHLRWPACVQFDLADPACRPLPVLLGHDQSHSSVQVATVLGATSADPLGVGLVFDFPAERLQ